MNMHEIWHLPTATSDELITAAAYACAQPSTPADHAIMVFVHQKGIAITATPVRTLAGDPRYVVYHNGAHYSVYAAGEPELVLHACRLSENVREKALLESRRMGKGGAQVIAIAHGLAPQQPTQPEHVKHLALYGLISVI